MKQLAATVFLLAAIAAAQTTLPAPPKSASLAESGGPAVLLQADRAFARDTASLRLEGWMAHMADDAVLFSSKPIIGKDAIRAHFQSLFADPGYSLSWQPTRGEIFPSGNMGYSTGRFRQQRRDDHGNQVVHEGAYLTVWRKQSDGSWKVVADGGSSDPH